MGAQSSQSRRGNEEGIEYTNLKHGLHVDYQTVGLFILFSKIFILSKHSFVLTYSEQHMNCVGMFDKPNLLVYVNFRYNCNQTRYS